MTAREAIMAILHVTGKEGPDMLDRELIIHGERGQIGPATIYIIKDPDGTPYVHFDLEEGGAEDAGGPEGTAREVQ